MGEFVTVVGGGLAGCECALQLARRGVRVRLYEQRPAHESPAHHTAGLAELVCSNSLKSTKEDTAAGLANWGGAQWQTIYYGYQGSGDYLEPGSYGGEWTINN